MTAMPDPMTADPRAVRTANDADMSRLLTAVQPRLHGFLRKLAGGDADDLVQETLARAWRSRDSFDRGRGSAEPWLLRIAFRVFLDQRKKHQVTVAATDDLPDAGSDPARRAELREQTAAMLECLTAPERDVLLRFHRDGESIDSIALALTMPKGTVKSHLHRARNRLWASRHQPGAEQ